jgi:DnaJ-class molecular chaperone
VRGGIPLERGCAGEDPTRLVERRLKGKGFPVYKKEGEFGDLFITYNIVLPTNLTEKQKELFTQLSKS